MEKLLEGRVAVVTGAGNGIGRAEAIGMALLDDDLRQALRTKGLEQAGRFSWTETAKRTLGVYQDVVRGGICSTYDKAHHSLVTDPDYIVGSRPEAAPLW